MKKALYIGIYSEGTTSKQRADILKKQLPEWDYQVIDTHIPFYQTNRIIRSVGFRTKRGPLVGKINKYILNNLYSEIYDFIWVDKGVFIKESTTKILRSKTKKLIHYTPDPAFTYHQSKHFLNSIGYYDYAITTKSYELEIYQYTLGKEKVIYSTQGFDPAIHKPYHSFEHKQFGVTFLGRYEKEREMLLQQLIEAQIPVILAGVNWKSFCKKNTHNKYLTYLGESISGEEYAKTISQYYFSLGLISKWIPEKHTTRTFEIPACGTVLITEKNEETASFFANDEVLFFDDATKLITTLLYFKKKTEKLKILSEKGRLAVTSKNKYDYKNLLEKILTSVRISID